MTFLPNDYPGEPVESNYMSFEEGENTFRILGSAKVGWEFWVDSGKRRDNGDIIGEPVRVKKEDEIPIAKVLEGKYGLNYSFFWAFPVYSFDNRKIQILTVKQKTVRRPMEKYIKNPKWGSPTNYNFVVSRDKDESGKTFYIVGVEPKEKLDQTILDRFKNMNIDMQVWFECDDPFTTQEAQNEAEEPVKTEEVKDVIDEIPF